MQPTAALVPPLRHTPHSPSSNAALPPQLPRSPTHAQVGSKAIDFIYTNPSAFSCVESEYGVAPIVSLRNFRKGFTLNQFGGTIFTRSNRTDINTIHDLRDKIVEAVSITGLGACQMQVLHQPMHLHTGCNIFSFGWLLLGRPTGGGGILGVVNCVWEMSCFKLAAKFTTRDPGASVKFPAH